MVSIKKAPNAYDAFGAFFEAVTWSEIAGTIPAMGAQLFFG